MIHFLKKLTLYPKHFRKVVLATYLRTRIVNRFKPLNAEGSFSIGQFRLKYPHYASMYVMFKEIFLDQNYYIPPTEEPITIIDCGSNIGDSVLYFKVMCPHAVIHAFEPNPTTFEYLKMNVAQNRLKDITLHNVALSSETGQLTFYTDKNDMSSQGASLTKHLESKKRELQELIVDAVRLSNLLPTKVDVLKLDIEGAEGDVLDDLSQSGRLSEFNLIFLEYHFDGVNTKYPLSRILARLEEAGFDYSIVSSFSLPFTKPKKIFSYKITAYKGGAYF